MTGRGGLLAGLGVLMVGACGVVGSPGTGPTGPFEVSEHVVSHPATAEISVWAPDVDGPWPVVYALHGAGGSRQDLAAMAAGLASAGMVVFVPDWAADGRLGQRSDEVECGFRYAMTIAAEFGGEVDFQPVVGVGVDAGASVVLASALDPRMEFSTPCLADTARPSLDLVVAIGGCYYDAGDDPRQFELAVSGWGNAAAEIVLVAAEHDEVCKPWQTRLAADALTRAGYQVNYAEIDDATHDQLIDAATHDQQAGPGRPAAEATLQLIATAVAAAQGRTVDAAAAPSTVPGDLVATWRQPTGDLLAPSGRAIPTFNAEPEHRALVEWALARYQAAGLAEPPVLALVFPPSDQCRERAGATIDHPDGHTVHICLNAHEVCTVPDGTTFDRRARLTVLHELAHAWERVGLDTATRTAFLELRDLDHWTANPQWSRRGTEQAAEIMAWGLLDEPVDLVKLPNRSCAELLDAYRLLTGTEPQRTDTCRTP